MGYWGKKNMENRWHQKMERRAKIYRREAAY